MYQIGDKVVHPMHGAGIIDDIVEDKVNGVARTYYVLKMPVGSMTVMIPTANCESIGVRQVMTSMQAEQMLKDMELVEVDEDQSWNRRYRENMERIKSGDLLKVFGVFKGLVLRDRSKGLSTGERKMLHTARQILVSELVMAVGGEFDEMEKSIIEKFI